MKLIEIYNLLLNGLKTKIELASFLDVTVKTIENNIKKTNEDIKYSKKLGRYHLRSLLPNYVTYSFVNSIIISNFNTKVLQNDISNIQKIILKKSDYLLKTDGFSELLKNLIILNIAINHNIVLSINYKTFEKKIIQPNQLFKIKDLYYLYITYDKQNKKNINEHRTLNISDISNMTFIEYSDSSVFKTDIVGNEYGHYSSKQFVLLTLRSDAANFFKKNNVNYLKWEFINESNDGQSINIKLFYNSRLEVKRLIQQWLPYISFTEDTIFSQKIINEIKIDLDSLSPF